MKKRKSIIFTTGLILLFAAGGTLASQQNNKDRSPAVKREIQSASTSSKENTKQATPSAKPSHSYAVRADLLNKPKEQAVTDNMIAAGESILSQRQVTPNQSTSFNFNAMAAGDFSSLAGTWMDANGYRFEFSPQGIVSSDGSLSMTALVYDENGEAVSNISTANGGGFLLHFYQAGLEIPTWHFGITNSDPSDFGRDRLFATQTNRYDYESTKQFIDSVFYKVSDSYSQMPKTKEHDSEQKADISNTEENSSQPRQEENPRKDSSSEQGQEDSYLNEDDD